MKTRKFKLYGKMYTFFLAETSKDKEKLKEIGKLNKPYRILKNGKKFDLYLR